MRLQAPWKSYGEEDVEQFPTGGPRDPVLYVPRDRSCCFVQTLDEDGEPSVHLADEHEMSIFWHRCRVLPLLAVMRVVGDTRAAE